MFPKRWSAWLVEKHTKKRSYILPTNVRTCTVLLTFLLKQIAINPKHENVLKRPKEEKNSSSQFLPADDDNNKVYTFF